MAARRRIAVIKLGSLGDVVQALGPMQAIRDHHAGEHITAITTRPYGPLLRATGWFDAVWEDGRPRRLRGLMRLIGRMRRARFSRVYDLQTSTRSSSYLWLLWPQRPEWSGVAFMSSHPHANPRRVAMHTVDRQAEQLRMAGIDAVPAPDLSFARANVACFNLPDRYAVLVPGGSAHRPGKRWPMTRYAELARRLVEQGTTPVILGAGPERGMAEVIKGAVPSAINLVNQTDYLQIIGVGRGARFAVGNDTGPMHLLAAAGAPSVVLFSQESDPSRCAPRGDRVKIMRVSHLPDLPVADVLAATGEVQR